jgi:hypothetical protein
MMFGSMFAAAIGAMQQELQMEAAFQRSLEGLAPEERARAVAAHKAALKERVRVNEHRELISAIRDSRPRGLGIFW